MVKLCVVEVVWLLTNVYNELSLEFPGFGCPDNTVTIHSYETASLIAFQPKELVEPEVSIGTPPPIAGSVIVAAPVAETIVAGNMLQSITSATSTTIDLPGMFIFLSSS